jgi:hypothetical protein
MLSWLPHRRARMESVEAEAEALVRDFGEAAYTAARRRGREASSHEIARDWNFVALAVARPIGERKDVNRLVRVGNECRSRFRSRSGRLTQASHPFPADAGRGAGARNRRHAAPFRIQFAGAAPDAGPITLTGVEIHATDASAAIVAAANLASPPRAIGLRLLDGEGREVFARQKADRRAGTTTRRRTTGSI